MDRLLAPLTIIFLCLSSCGSSGNGGSDDSLGGNGNASPWAISRASQPATATDVRNLLEAGDRYRYEADNVAANTILDDIWARLIAAPSWVGTNPLYTYRFYNDIGTITNWGRAFRHTGFDESAGPITAFTAGTYTSVSGAEFPAVILRTWDDEYAEILVLTSEQSFTHAIQHFNGLPIIEHYQAATNG